MTRGNFQQKFSGIYNWLKKNNPELLDKILPALVIYWDFQSIQKEALKYNTRSEWKKNSPNSYAAAQARAYLKCCSKHMVSGRTGHRAKRVKNIETNKIYKSITEAINDGYKDIHRALKNHSAKCGGYRWAYCDEKGNILE